MKIFIQTHRKFSFFFWIPNIFISCKWIWKRALKNTKEIQIEEVIRFIPIIKKEIKNIKKNFGCLTIVDVKSSDNVRVKIKL